MKMRIDVRTNDEEGQQEKREWQ